MQWAGSTLDINHQVQGVEADAICAPPILYELTWAWSDLFDPSEQKLLFQGSRYSIKIQWVHFAYKIADLGV